MKRIVLVILFAAFGATSLRGAEVFDKAVEYLSGAWNSAVRQEKLYAEGRSDGVKLKDGALMIAESGSPPDNAWTYRWWNGREKKRIDYLFMIGWDPQAKKYAMTMADSEGNYGLRTATYDGPTKTIHCRHEGVFSTGPSLTYDLRVRPSNDRVLEFHGTNARSDEKDLPELKLTFTRK